MEDFLTQENEYQAFIEDMERQQQADSNQSSNQSNHSQSGVYGHDDDSILADILSQVESEMHENMDTSG